MRDQMNLHIITPKRVILTEKIHSITVPSSEGELTILPHHISLFSLLVEGIVRYKTEKKEEFLAIGGGYIETDGQEVKLLVSRAYGQDQIDKAATEKAIEDAKRDMKQPKDKQQLKEVSSLLRKSLIDLKLLKKKAPKTFSEQP